MNIPQTQQYPDDPEKLPPARRRRARRLLAPLNADERADFLTKLAHRTSPTFDFFLFSIISGVLIGFGLLINETAILVLGALLAPMMAPFIGISLGTVIGSTNFFFRSLAGFLLGSLLVFLVGVIAGYVTKYWSPTDFSITHYYAQLSWPNFLLLAVGAVVTSIGIVHYERTVNISSVALAYELYIPITVAGFGLTGGIPNLWPDGLVVYSVYLAWGVLIGAFTFAILGFRPLTLFGYTLGGVVILLSVILLIGLSGAGAVIGANVGLPTKTPTITATPVPPTATLTPTHTPIPPTATYTPTQTPIPPTATHTATNTATLTPTPMFAVIDAGEYGGAFVRVEPAGEIIGLVANGTIVQVFADTQEAEGTIWVRVITPNGLNGWMDQVLLVQPAPIPTPTTG